MSSMMEYPDADHKDAAESVGEKEAEEDAPSFI